MAFAELETGVGVATGVGAGVGVGVGVITGVINGVGVGAGVGVAVLVGIMELPLSVTGTDGEFDGFEILPETFAGPQF